MRDDGPSCVYGERRGLACIARAQLTETVSDALSFRACSCNSACSAPAEWTVPAAHSRAVLTRQLSVCCCHCSIIASRLRHGTACRTARHVRGAQRATAQPPLSTRALLAASASACCLAAAQNLPLVRCCVCATATLHPKPGATRKPLPTHRRTSSSAPAPPGASAPPQ